MNKSNDISKKVRVKSLLDEEYEIYEKELDVLKLIFTNSRDEDRLRIGARTLRKKFTREFIEAMEKKSPKLIEYNRQDWDEFYYLTLRGFYLCPDAREDFELIGKYVMFLKEKYNCDPEMREISSKEVTIALNLTEEQTRRLGILISFIHLYSRGGSSGSEGWKWGEPSDIEELDISDNPKEYLKKRLENEEKRLPDQDLRLNTQISFEDELSDESKKSVKPLSDLTEMLGFLKSDELKTNVKKDLEDLMSLQYTNAHKAVLIFCGIIIETILLDILDRRPDVAQSYFNKTKYWPEKASLEDMINIAKRENLISETSAKIGEILKIHRDLVHPYRIFRSRIVIDSDTAKAMVLLLKMIVRDLGIAYNDGYIKAYEEK